MDCYPLEGQQSMVIPDGGRQRVATSKEFPVSTTMAGSVIELQPGGIVLAAALRSSAIDNML